MAAGAHPASGEAWPATSSSGSSSSSRQPLQQSAASTEEGEEEQLHLDSPAPTSPLLHRRRLAYLGT